MKKSGIIILILAFLLGLTAACKKGGESAPPAGTTPIDDLIKAGKGPVEVGSMFKGINPVMPTFTLSLKNVSDRPVQMILGTVLYFDENDKLIPESKADLNYGELEVVKPGASIELQTMTEHKEAVRGKWIIKEVVYLKMNPVDKAYGELPYKWTNPNYETELKAAENK